MLGFAQENVDALGSDSHFFLIENDGAAIR
jgi:hypothetical protein